MIGGRTVRRHARSGCINSGGWGSRLRFAARVVLVVFCFGRVAMGLDGRVLPPTETPVYEDGGDSESRSKAYRAAHPEWDEAFERFHKHFDSFIARFPDGEVVGHEQARELLDELYFDSGNSRLNLRWQDVVLGDLTRAALNAQTTPATLEIIRSGLTEYENVGGGNAGPLLRMSLAMAFCSVSDEAHP